MHVLIVDHCGSKYSMTSQGFTFTTKTLFIPGKKGVLNGPEAGEQDE